MKLCPSPGTSCDLGLNDDTCQFYGIGAFCKKRKANLNYPLIEPNGGWEGLICGVCGRTLKFTKFGVVHAETGKAYWERPDGTDDHCARLGWTGS